MNLKKPFLLFLALILPIGVFVFLKFFGKNEFAVPVLFSEEVTRPGGCESFTYAAPYFIPDTVLANLKWNSYDSISLIIFGDTSASNQQEQSIQLNRIFTEFPSDQFQVFFFTENPEVQKTAIPDKRLVIVSELQSQSIRNCIFLLRVANNTVMLDSKKRIRGQYNLTDREEVDRLILEIKIMLRKY